MTLRLLYEHGRRSSAVGTDCLRELNKALAQINLDLAAMDVSGPGPLVKRLRVAWTDEPREEGVRVLLLAGRVQLLGDRETVLCSHAKDEMIRLEFVPRAESPLVEQSAPFRLVVELSYPDIFASLVRVLL